ncbi:MAG TPA: protease HtpX [Burkholderiaceae bacterium]|nr:protease HtpX [Burkholderiaceae bacterium]
MKRVALFVLTNLAIVIMLGVVTSVLGVNRFLTARGLDLGMLLAFAAVIGFGGAFFSLLISKPMAKFSTGARTIGQPSNAMEAWLLDTVRHHADKAGLAMPEVAIYEGEPNAFATGAFKNSALVAISTGLLQTMSKEEVEAVLGHEITHVSNGDMVTMTLLQGVLNTFVVFLSKVLAYVIDRMILRNEDEGPGIGYFAVDLTLNIVFGLLAGIVVAWFSRRREFRADAGSAQILGSPRPMISALQRLGGLESGELPRQISAFGIAGGAGGLGMLFASHPPIEQRIAALRALGN